MRAAKSGPPPAVHRTREEWIALAFGTAAAHNIAAIGLSLRARRRCATITANKQRFTAQRFTAVRPDAAEEHTSMATPTNQTASGNGQPARNPIPYLSLDPAVAEAIREDRAKGTDRKSVV